MTFVAADTNVLIHFLQGDGGADIVLLRRALLDEALLLPPPVLSEMASAPLLPEQTMLQLQALPLLPLTQGFWVRAGLLRREIRAKGFKAHLADALIAQCCIDNTATLITRDRDFRHYVDFGGLKVA